MAAPRLLGDLSGPARSSVHLASSAELEGVSGAYFTAKCRRAAWPASALGERGQDAIWRLCEDLMAG